MRIVCISDTHEQHRDIKVPDGDILIHAGDIAYSYNPLITHDFIEWFECQPHRDKFFVAGNHDFYLEKHELINHTYLNNTWTVAGKIKIFGSPITPTFGNWAFMKNRGNEIKKVWDRIPIDTDIIITHGPPSKILDLTPPQYGSTHVGCWDLREAIFKIKPKLHVFGHIHDGYGKTVVNGITFVNASICNEQYKAINKPIVIDL